MTTLREQAAKYIEHLKTRRRNPAKPNTLTAYGSYIEQWILPEMGDLPLESIENGVMKKFVTVLAEADLSASTIIGIANVAKGIIGSAQDENGNELYPRKWNNEFLDLPILNPDEQDAPIVSGKEITWALKRATGQYRALLMLLAGTGLRIGEARALKLRNDDGVGSFYLPDHAVVRIRVQLQDGVAISPKTRAAVRDVDLCPELNEALIKWTSNMRAGNFLFTQIRDTTKPARQITLWEEVCKKVGIPGFHSLRRFRVTHLRSNPMIPEDFRKYWIGHGKKDITDRYSQVQTNIELRREMAKKAGLGFKLVDINEVTSTEDIKDLPQESEPPRE